MAGRRNDAETVDERRDRLLRAHVAGESPRTLAEQEGVSLSQVYRDIKAGSAELRESLLRGDMPAAARMILVAQEIGARALREGRYGAALRALDMEARLRLLVPPDERREAATPEEAGADPWAALCVPSEGPAPSRDPVLGEVSRQRGSPR